MECLLLLHPGMVKPTRAGETAHGSHTVTGGKKVLVRLQPGRGKVKPCLARLNYRGPSLPVGRAHLRLWTRASSPRPASILPVPLRPCCRRTSPGRALRFPAFAFTARHRHRPYPLQRAQAAATHLFSSPTRRDPSAPSRSLEFSVSALPKERHPEPNDSGSSRVPGRGGGAKRG
jgi:hypothetical protein